MQTNNFKIDLGYYLKPERIDIINKLFDNLEFDETSEHFRNIYANHQFIYVRKNSTNNFHMSYGNKPIAFSTDDYYKEFFLKDIDSVIKDINADDEYEYE